MPASARVLFFGQNSTPGLVTDEDAFQAQDDFLNALGEVATEDFEAFGDDDPGPLALLFTGSAESVSATLTSADGRTETGAFSGAFATSGSLFWFASDSLAIDFDSPIVAFGFFVSDFEGSTALPVTLQLGLESGGTVDIPIPVTSAPDATLAFFGTIDADNPFTSVTLTGPSTIDTFGFDDLIVATAVPFEIEMGASLILLGATFAYRRYRRLKSGQ